MKSGKQKVLSLEPKWYALEILVSIVISVIVSLLLVLLAALIIKQFSLGDTAIAVIICIIKIISVLVGCLICLKRPKNGWIRGALSGMLYIWASYMVFSLLGDGFSFGLSLLNDTMIGMVAGLISGIIAVNIRRN